MQHEDASPVTGAPHASARRRLAHRRLARRAVVISVAVHVVAATALLCWYLPIRMESGPAQTVPNPPALAGAAEPPPPDRPSAASRAVSEQIQKSLDQQITRQQTQPPATMLDELEQNLSRLERGSSPASLEQMTNKITQSMGLDRDQYSTKTAIPPGMIDFDSAQIEDVSRRKDDRGEWEYEVILVDSQGRTSRTQVDASEGAVLYDTFEKIKRFPMAEGIYRQIVMPLMQKMIAGQATPIPD
ncbi:MAG: PepSY domain-containing protein [Novipirellula sp. JB048]